MRGLDPLRTYGPLHWDPLARTPLYLQLGSDVYWSTDDGVTWRLRDDGLPSDQGIVAPLSQVTSLVGGPRFAWVDSPGEKPCHGLGCPPAPLERHLYKLRQGAASWTELPVVTTATDRWFQDDQQPSVLYATPEDGHLLRSFDGGATFSYYLGTPFESLGTRPRDGWPVKEIADPAANGTRYRVRWQAPVQRSTDGGTTWERFGEDLVPYDAEGLVLVPYQGGGPRVLLVTTDAGVWATRLDGGVFPPPPEPLFAHDGAMRSHPTSRITVGRDRIPPSRSARHRVAVACGSSQTKVERASNIPSISSSVL